MNLKKLIRILVLVAMLILVLLVIFWSTNRKSVVTTVYVSDSTDVGDKIIWDKNKKLLKPDLYKEIVNSKDSIAEVKTNLNGLVYYRIDKETKEKSQVFKRDYQQEDFYVTLSNDTIYLIDTVCIEVGVTHFRDDNYSIHVYEDEIYEIEKLSFENSTVFRYKASNFDSLGIKSFKAAVKFEGDSLYVEYKFVVVDSVNL